MGLFKRRPRTGVERLMAAAGLPTTGGEIPVRDLVMEVVRHSSGRVAATLAVAEDLLVEEDDLARVALAFLEDLQNAASHGVQGLLTIEDLLRVGLSDVVLYENATGVSMAAFGYHPKP